MARATYNPAGIPEELRLLSRWVRFTVGRNGKKIPYRVGTDAKAASDNPRTWATFEAAHADATARGDWVGFAFDPSLGMAFVDLDDVFTDANGGTVKGWAQELVDRLDSYTEVSASGRGLHVIARGPLPEGYTIPDPPPGEHRAEVYPRKGGRFCVFTGAMRGGLGNMSGRIEERAAELAALFPPGAARGTAGHAYAGEAGQLASSDIDAIAMLLAPHYVPGQRHHLALHAAGWLAKQGVPEAQAADIVYRIAVGDDDGGARSIAAVRDTYQAIRDGESVAGYMGLRNIVGIPDGALARIDAVLTAFYLNTRPIAQPLRDPGELVAGADRDTHDARDTEGGDMSGSDDEEAGGGANTEPGGAWANGGRGAERPSVVVSGRGLEDVSADAWRVLTAANDPARLFRHGGTPARVGNGDEGGPSIQPLSEHRLRHELARAAGWYTLRSNKEGAVSRHTTNPPLDVCRDMLAAPDFPLPVLEGVIEAPGFAADGSLPAAPGYHPAGRVYYAPAPGFVLPPIAQAPTRDDVAAAVALLTDDLLVDFPFVGQAERAHAVALILLPFLRGLISGPTPLHLVEKPAAGTGASLLSDVVARLATGRAIAAMSEARDDGEWGKKLTAKLRKGDPLLIIDNLRRRLDSAAVASALTASHYEDRLLGTSDVVRIPVRCTWLATANNAALSSEITRRTVRIRLDAKEDRPWERDPDSFKHPQLLDWVQEHRAELVAACLTLGQAWIAAGRPAATTRASLGSYEAWARVMGGVLEVAGIEGFLGNLTEFYDASDSEGAAIRGFLSGWWGAHGSRAVGVAELFPLATGDASMIDLGSGTERSQRTRLGKLLGELRDRRYTIGDGTLVCITPGPTVHSTNTYRLVAIDTTGTSTRGTWGDVGDVGDVSSTHEGSFSNSRVSRNTTGTERETSPTSPTSPNVPPRGTGDGRGVGNVRAF